MKKIFIFMLLAGFLFGSVVYTQAAPWEVWIEHTPDGDGDFDFEMTFVGAEYTKDRFKFGLELGDGDIENDDDVNLWEGKIGYTLVDGAQIGLGLYVSKLNVEGDWVDFDCVLAGVDFDWMISQHSSIKATLGYTVDTDLNGDEDVDLLAYKLKYEYQVNKMIYLNAGYRGYQLDHGRLDSQLDSGGLFAGLSIKL